MAKRNDDRDHSTTDQPAPASGDGATIEEGDIAMKTPDHLIKKAPSTTTDYTKPPVKTPSTTEMLEALFPAAHEWMKQHGLVVVDRTASPDGSAVRVRGERPTLRFNGRPTKRSLRTPGRGTVSAAAKQAADEKIWEWDETKLDFLKFIEGLVRIQLMTKQETGRWRIPAVYAMALSDDAEVAALLDVSVCAVTALRARFNVPQVSKMNRYGVVDLIGDVLGGRESGQYEPAETAALRLAECWSEEHVIGKQLFLESLHSANFPSLLREWLKLAAGKRGNAAFLERETREALGEGDV